MLRSEAIEIIAHSELPNLTASDRDDLLAEWWTIDRNDPDFHGLPENLRTEMLQNESPRESADPRYAPLLEAALRFAFRGVQNSYLQKRLSTLGIQTGVEGTAEPLFACPCCGYRTLTSRMDYDICKVCYWEDDGSEHWEDRISGPNGISIRKGRENFLRFGAAKERSRQFIPTDALERYPR